MSSIARAKETWSKLHFHTFNQHDDVRNHHARNIPAGLQFCRTLGNQAMLYLSNTGIIQRKLIFGKPKDKYEQEADRIAEMVMRMPDPNKQTRIQCREDKKEKVHAKRLVDIITPVVQQHTTTAPEALSITSDIEKGICSLKGNGRPLSKRELDFFEPRFGMDFSNVRIHTGDVAAESTKDLNAQAYTVENDVVMGDGKYSPGSESGKKLLGHELVHAVQQSESKKLTRGISTTFTEEKNKIIPGSTQVACQDRDLGNLFVYNCLNREGHHILQCKNEEVPKNTNVHINYKKAERLNKYFSKKDNLGWGIKLVQTEGEIFKIWDALWKAGKYDEFADAIAEYQKTQGFPDNQIDGILGIKTWGIVAGLGEIMAGIIKVSEEAEDGCTKSTHYRISHAYKISGKKLEMPEKNDWNTYKDILYSRAHKMADIDEKYRGTGAAGAIVYAGFGEFVSEDDIWKGQLKPGAVIQAWYSRKDFNLLKKGYIKESGKKRPLKGGIGGDISWPAAGSSFVFVRYDPNKYDRIRVRHYGKTEWKRKSEFKVWIAANVKKNF